ncbi:peptide ABC transporter permease [Listeria welshimeri]|uniref:peptide ABC transporter permease n=1 Tax=Listeria welshimeri TaxID=1643 RepID=UPI0010B5D405|nr:peptide ABC transporter permease [Listeria welshimeri]MBC2091138.1 peptide ABC transporter permease [Listeria welshimeri]MBC2355084.1 peptide ABC transporter permease [Listeria welshimeri]MBC2357383.1 peptide ABC transporter permease [Listeria welshimeri]MBC6158210.1 peptide ABC transporter permease [Listeria welshimeri]MBS9362214.1 peptide ABC transporter permease [Listeria welshimeri]
MKRLIIMTSVFLGTLLIGSAFTGRKPFDGTDISLIGGLSVFILAYFLVGFLSRTKKN